MSLSQPEKNSKEQKDSSSLILFLLNMTSFGVHAATAATATAWNILMWN